MIFKRPYPLGQKHQLSVQGAGPTVKFVLTEFYYRDLHSMKSVTAK